MESLLFSREVFPVIWISGGLRLGKGISEKKYSVMPRGKSINPGIPGLYPRCADGKMEYPSQAGFYVKRYSTSCYQHSTLPLCGRCAESQVGASGTPNGSRCDGLYHLDATPASQSAQPQMARTRPFRPFRWAWFHAPLFIAPPHGL
jgi:hypothetical protein